MITLSGVSPAEGERLVIVNTPIEFTIVDDGSGIDISTLIVEIAGDRAITDGLFLSGFLGPLSLISASGSDYIVTVDRESFFSLGQIIPVKIQVKTLDGKYFNYTYSFKIIPSEPILVTSSPSNGAVLESSQVLFLEFEDIIDGIDGTSINITINELPYIISGAAAPDVNDILTDVSLVLTSALVRVDPIESLRNGMYILGYNVKDTLGNVLIGSISFEVKLPIAELPLSFPHTGFLGYFQGIERVSDIGTGDSLLVEWGEPIKKNYKNEAFVLVYEDDIRFNTFDNPIYIADGSILQAIVPNLTTGKKISYGARALELEKGLLTVSGMELVDSGFSKLPNKTAVSFTVGIDDFLISVDSVSGYPDTGLIVIGREVIRYTSIDRVNNSFGVPTNGRALFGSVKSIYLVGDSVSLWLNCTDLNTVIVMATPSIQDGYNFDRAIDGEGLVVTDYTDNDNKFFQGYDFCGYHDPRPDLTLTGAGGNDCGSYLGGEFNKMRGFNLYDRMLNREDVLLDQTGEPVILLKRNWSTETCDCMDFRKMSPKVKSCNVCYGTGYVGGYTQYNNLRRKDRRIVVSFNESPEDLLHGEKEHLQQEFEPSAWTLPIPSIRDRDVLVRFDFTNDLEFIYEVLHTSREKILFRNFGRQTMNLKRLDKTDIVYTYIFDFGNIV